MACLPPQTTIRVLIADDSVVIQEGLSALLSGHADLELVGIASNGVEAIAKAESLLPDLVVMDARMPELDGIEATRIIKRTFPHIGVLCFSVFSEHMEAGIAAGADAYLEKDCDPDDVAREIRRIVRSRRQATST